MNSKLKEMIVVALCFIYVTFVFVTVISSIMFAIYLMYWITSKTLIGGILYILLMTFGLYMFLNRK